MSKTATKRASKATAPAARSGKSSAKRAKAPAARSRPFPIVAVGASAGGLEPFLTLLRELGKKPGLALIFVQHQEPRHESGLPKVLARATPMTVEVAADGRKIEANRVYVTPGDAQVAIDNGILRVSTMVDRVVLPVDAVFRSLAEDQGPRALGAILSGSASDGSMGIQAIKAEGGLTFAQDQSAKFDGMPQSAIATGCVDFVLPPEEIATELRRIAAQVAMGASAEGVAPLPQRELAKLFPLLSAAHNLDFAHYKPATVERRIRRRMAVHKMEQLSDYVRLLQSSPNEIDQLYDEILIRVTGFFRDPQVFEAIRRDVFPTLMRDRDSHLPLRIWVPGCATGEEVYSLAILFLEAMKENGWQSAAQIFGTDVNEVSIQRARAGVYSASIAADLTPERLRKYFQETEGGLRVNKAVRDCCVFAQQNLTTDPPFSKLDLISCRNLLIYFGPTLQQRVMSIFHFALQPDGFLLLGNSESIGRFNDLFSVFDRRNRIYRKKPGERKGAPELPSGIIERTPRARVRAAESTESAIFREADRVLLSKVAPAGVVINDRMEILQFRGNTNDFLELPPGTPSLQLMKMARSSISVDLRAILQIARKSDAPVQRTSVALQPGSNRVQIDVIPFHGPSDRRYYLVLFKNVPDPEAPVAEEPGKKSKESRRELRLRRELESTRDYLQSIIDEQEVMNEELRSASDLVEVSNQELQSTNEELQTAKEELQSTNEELTTLNEELDDRNQELGKSSNDLANLLASIDIPILMLDNAMRVRRFSPGAQKILNLSAADIGRSMDDLQVTLQIEHLQEIVAKAMEADRVHEVEVHDRAGRHYLLRARPYKTVDDRIEGVVLVLLESSGKRAPVKRRRKA